MYKIFHHLFSGFPVIRGADNVAQTTVEITADQPLDFHWEGHGFKVHIPPGAIRRERGRVTLYIQASLNGDYQLPDDGVLVSGVYWLSLHPHVERFDKKVTIQHCASHNDSTLSFITTTNQTPPHAFKLLPGGYFEPQYGTIHIESSAGFALYAKERVMYAFETYYLPQQHNANEAHFTVTPDLELHLKVCNSWAFLPNEGL